MSEHSELLAEAGTIQWEREVRGYNRQQVDEYVAWRTGQVRELENRLSQGLAEIERLRHEVAEAREAAARPAHEEISERVGQILKLAADEASAERERSAAEIAAMHDSAVKDSEALRSQAAHETDKLRSDTQEQAERMLVSAREESERLLSAARADSEQLVEAANATAERTVGEANQHAESTVAAAMAQAKQQLDEATARATAIHDGAERRLNLLISRHTETVRRLTEIRDVVTNLVSGETTRGSLEDEVARALASQAAAGGDGRSGRRPSGQGDARVPNSGPGGRAAGGAVSRDGEHADALSAERPDDPRHAEHADAALPIEASVKADDLRTDGGENRQRSDGAHRHGGATGTLTRQPERTID